MNHLARRLMACGAAALLAMVATDARSFDVKGLDRGSTLDDFNRLFNNACAPGPTGWDNFKRCRVSTSYAGKPVELVAGFFEGTTLDEIALVVSLEDSDFLIEALGQKYGKPKTIGTVTMQNSYGAKFLRRTAKWEKSEFQIVVMPGSAVGTMGIVFTSGRALAREAEKRKQERGNVKKDM